MGLSMSDAGPVNFISTIKDGKVKWPKVGEAPSPLGALLAHLAVYRIIE